MRRQLQPRMSLVQLYRGYEKQTSEFCLRVVKDRYHSIKYVQVRPKVGRRPEQESIQKNGSRVEGLTSQRV